MRSRANGIWMQIQPSAPSVHFLWTGRQRWLRTLKCSLKIYVPHGEFGSRDSDTSQSSSTARQNGASWLEGRWMPKRLHPSWSSYGSIYGCFLISDVNCSKWRTFFFRGAVPSGNVTDDQRVRNTWTFSIMRTGGAGGWWVTGQSLWSPRGSVGNWSMESHHFSRTDPCPWSIHRFHLLLLNLVVVYHKETNKWCFCGSAGSAWRSERQSHGFDPKVHKHKKV